MKFVSIDSSLAHTGLAIGTITPENNILVEELLLVETEKTKNKQVRASSDTIIRCRTTYEFVKSVLEKYKPQIVFVETPSGSQTASGMKSYGTTCQLIAVLEPQPIEVQPLEVKMASVGKKTASKEEIINWAYALYPNTPGWKWHGGKLQGKNEHVADAIAIAHAGIKTSEFKRLKSYKSL